MQLEAFIRKSHALTEQGKRISYYPNSLYDIYCYLVLNIVSDIKDETIVGIIWPPQLQLVKVDRDQVSFYLRSSVNGGLPTVTISLQTKQIL